jgi:hypothetical protein
MNTEQTTALISRLTGGDASVAGTITHLALTSEDPLLLVAAALLAPGTPGLLSRASELATSTQDRHVVAIVAAHLNGDPDRAAALAQDHLADLAIPNPGAALVAWITTPQTQENR